jgi:hypothetical protein
VSQVSAEEILKKKIIQKAWEDPSFKAKLLSEPKAALKEAFGIDVPDTINLKAVEETTNSFYLVIPANPSNASFGISSANATW